MVAVTRTIAVDAEDPITGSTGSETLERDPVIEAIIDAFEPLHAAQRRVMAKVWQDRSISKLNLHLLMLLDANGPQSMSRLAALANVALPNLTGTVRRMEELGLVARESDSRDRRVVVVRETSRGRALLQELESIRRDELRRILLALSPAERHQCLDAMRIMARAATVRPPDATPSSQAHAATPRRT
jgi:DNA-binding MarR family transcriptional regulator